MNATPYDADILQASNVYGLPLDLLRAQIEQESGGDPFAFRFEHTFFVRYIRDNAAAKGAQYGPLAACSYGMLQILLETAMEMGFADRPEQLFIPRVGLTWGARKMQVLVQRYGVDNYRSALAAYNAGTGNLNAGLPYADAVLLKAGRS
jgi:soluble lytic murein transglycosylase-like protein